MHKYFEQFSMHFSDKITVSLFPEKFDVNISQLKAWFDIVVFQRVLFKN